MFEQVESELPARVSAAVTGQPDSWAAATAGLTAFLDACQRPEILQIALTDAPAVLGWAEWRAIETRHGLGLIQAVLERAMAESVITRQPVDVLAHLVLSAVIEAALLVAHASDHDTARAHAERALRALLDGLRR